ncbi:helix-turn-helix protein, YlxM/p13 family [Lactobacillus iners SPIN 2503V10-D]|nr:helix-turn-helix protein, YlxM/p13 family [Lactobacillus iners SPIN 2503V10-D]
MNELQKNELYSNLYGFYGKLLTKRQQDYFEDYYYSDLSLGEIADNHGVSRQAVF